MQRIVDGYRVSRRKWDTLRANCLSIIAWISAASAANIRRAAAKLDRHVLIVSIGPKYSSGQAAERADFVPKSSSAAQGS
jgi:hypothetical protein